MDFFQGFSRGPVYHPVKTVFEDHEDPSERERRQQPKSM